MDYIPYNSQKDYHKYPFGAVKTGSSIVFNVILPRSLMCSGVFLLIHADDCHEDRIALSWSRMEGDDEEWWTLEYRADEEGLYFYHFEFETAFGGSNILHDGSCLGSLNGGEHEWQLTVYDKEFSTPDWLKGGLIYQIFPDRFCASGIKKEIPEGRIMRSDWGGEPAWRPDADGKVKNNDFFGGDLKGIESKLPYLKSLGVSCIYLNPIFESHSNHRYDTADYSRIDPVLGSNDDFGQLCESAKKLGISVILDGVFSHTGDDSVYFNKYGRYKELGAYQSENSPYYPWYKFNEFPDDYECWWGFPTLPEVDEENDEYIDFIAGEKGILKKWLKAGARGWRLDVADELPDKFLDELRRSVKSEDEDAVIIGEVWEDASSKCAYGLRRRYLSGRQLDSVMNYPFCEAIVSFIRTGVSEGFHQKVLTILENYPKCAVDVLMNHIGTHDTSRAITRLVGESSERRDRQWQSEKKLSEEDFENGVMLLKLASLIQYTLPGVPSLYYGDEAGMEGYKDPFNRCCYPWSEENEELLHWYGFLGNLRGACDCLKEGEYLPVSDMISCVCFARKSEKDSILVIVNRNNSPIDYTVPQEWEDSEVMLGEKTGRTVTMPPLSGAVLYKKKISEHFSEEQA